MEQYIYFTSGVFKRRPTTSRVYFKDPPFRFAFLLNYLIRNLLLNGGAFSVRNVCLTMGNPGFPKDCWQGWGDCVQDTDIDGHALRCVDLNTIVA